MDIDYVLSNLVEGCKDQNGSRLIQIHFEKCGTSEREQLFQQIFPHVESLITDVFGNYVIQKILELGTSEQKLKIYGCIKKRVTEYSHHVYGCRVIQKVLEEFKTNEEIQDEILNEIETDIAKLIQDQNGNHVIQKCFEAVPIKKLEFILVEVTERVNELALHPFGCRVIQRILETCDPKITQPMVKKLMDTAYQCCQCQYGNYIMQYVLEQGPPEEKALLYDVLRKNFVRLSMNKFSSNVTEKSVRLGNGQYRADVVASLLNQVYEQKLGLVVLMTHAFGNYVVQKLFEACDPKLKKTIFDKIQTIDMSEIMNNNYGKHVMNAINKSQIQ